MSKRFQEAMNFVMEVYEGDVRKGTGVPSIHHPLGVCDIVMGAGGSEDACIGALLHDCAEDKGGRAMLERIRDEFGPYVAEIVEECSDTFVEESAIKEPWILRKVAHIKHISEISQDSCLVLAADTLHNTRNHVQGFRVNGMPWWDKFRANVYLDEERTPDIGVASTAWYIDHKCGALQARVKDNPKLLEATVDDLYCSFCDLRNLMSMPQKMELNCAIDYVHKQFGELIKLNVVK